MVMMLMLIMTMMMVMMVNIGDDDDNGDGDDGGDNDDDYGEDNGDDGDTPSYWMVVMTMMMISSPQNETHERDASDVLGLYHIQHGVSSVWKHCLQPEHTSSSHTPYDRQTKFPCKIRPLSPQSS